LTAEGDDVEIQNPRFMLNEGYAELHFELHGKTAVVLTDSQKRALSDSGLVYLGGDFEDDVPEIAWTFPETGEVFHLRGFTRDARVLKLFRRLCKAANLSGAEFPVGPVALDD